jgi:general secretion pathway protein F
MPAFRYEAVNAAGKTAKGVLDAESIRHARSLLREQGLSALEVQAVSAAATTGSKRTVFASKVKASELALSTRQLASLLAARLPLEQALGAVVEQAESSAVRERFAAVRSEVTAGSTLSQALNQFPKDFPEVYRALVAAGEQSGELSIVMGKLADYIESRTALAQRILLAFTYPAIVTLVAILVIGALMAFVVPKVIGVFASSKQELPLLTVILIALSDFLKAWWLWLAALVVAAFVMLRVALRAPALRLQWDGWLLKLPLFGRLIRGVNTARFASTLAILAASGVPLIRALEAGAQTLTNMALKETVAQAVARVREGTTLSRALAAGGKFPPVMVHMIASGEATGRLPEMLNRTADNLAQETERRALTLTGLLEPLLVLVMGGVVLLIVLAVLLPIIEINQLVR